MRKKKFMLDSLLSIVGTAIPIIFLQLFTLPIIGSRLGGDQYGLVVTLISLYTLFSFPFGNVLNNIRLLLDMEYQKKHQTGDFNVLLSASLMISSFLVIIGTTYYEGHFSFINSFMILLISCMNLVREYLTVSFRIKLDYKLIMIDNVILGAGYMLGTYLFTLTGFWQLIFIVGYGLSLVFIIKNSSLLKEPFKITERFKATTYNSMILLFSSLFKNLLVYADKLLIFPLLGPTAVSIYYTATLIGKLMSMVINPINNVLLSYLAKLEKLSSKAFVSLLFVSGSVGIVGYAMTIFISPYILNYLYPAWANESMKYIYVTSATAVIAVINTVIHPFILRFNSINWQPIISGSNVILYVVASLILYRNYGLMGFCIAILLSSVTQMILMVSIFIVSNRRNNNRIIKSEKMGE